MLPQRSDPDARGEQRHDQALGEQLPQQAAAPAPIAVRMTSSRSRRAMRARIRFATLAHAISSTNAAAPSSATAAARASLRELLAQHQRRDARSPSGRIGSRDARCSSRAAIDRQIGARLFQRDARFHAAERAHHARVRGWR